MTRDVHARELGMVWVLLDEFGDPLDRHIEVSANVDTLREKEQTPHNASRTATTSNYPINPLHIPCPHKSYLEFRRVLAQMIEREIREFPAVLDVQIPDLYSNNPNTNMFSKQWQKRTTLVVAPNTANLDSCAAALQSRRR